MKATTWLWPVLILLCATKLACTAQRGGYPLDYADSNMIQDDYLLEKRNKPSLSIVNPLDVLRQRLLLEIARRQMKENTRQVELNRAILKNVGKRVPIVPLRLLQQSTSQHSYHNMQRRRRQQQQQQLQQEHQRYYPNAYNYLPRTLTIFDVLRSPTTTDANRYDERLDDEKKALNMFTAVTNETTNHENANVAGNAGHHHEMSALTIDANGNGSGGGGGVGGAATTRIGSPSTANAAMRAIFDGNDVINENDVDTNASEVDENADNDNDNDHDNANLMDDDANAGYQLRYLYHLHNNHFVRK